MKASEYFIGIMEQANLIIKEEVLETLKYLGEQSVTKARNRPGEDSWFDQTGNLRSSIGYGIYEYGRSYIRSAFPVVKNGSNGSAEGEAMINELAKQYSSTYALVVIAAMSYSELVEAKDNKDVLASTELWARDVVDGYMERAKKKAEVRINALLR